MKFATNPHAIARDVISEEDVERRVADALAQLNKPGAGTDISVYLFGEAFHASEGTPKHHDVQARVIRALEEARYEVIASRTLGHITIYIQPRPRL